MELYFLRHALAVEPGDFREKDDSKRPLTEEGIKRMTQAAKGIKKMGLEFNHIVSSPYLRAKHTAQITAQAVSFKEPIQFFEELVPEANFKDLLRVLKQFKNDEKVLIVGHEPSIGMFVSNLVSSEDIHMDFKKGSLCRVDVAQTEQPYNGELKWLLNSKHLRAIA